jgi:hypothetical protein
MWSSEEGFHYFCRLLLTEKIHHHQLSVSSVNLLKVHQIPLLYSIISRFKQSLIHPPITCHIHRLSTRDEDSRAVRSSRNRGCRVRELPLFPSYSTPYSFEGKLLRSEENRSYDGQINIEEALRCLMHFASRQKAQVKNAIFEIIEI